MDAFGAWWGEQIECGAAECSEGMARAVWGAAVAAERERCAKVVEDADRPTDEAVARGVLSPNPSGRANSMDADELGRRGAERVPADKRIGPLDEAIPEGFCAVGAVAAHHCLDGAGVPRDCPQGVYSLWGRVLEYAKMRVAAERERLTPKWTRDVPTAPGVYWLRLPGRGIEAVDVFKVDYARRPQMYFYKFGEDGSRSCDSQAGGEWCGPLPVPGEGAE